MKRANDPHIDYKRLVREGYDAIADVYDAARAPASDLQALRPVLERLGPGTTALDIGCGAGRPVCQPLAEEAYTEPDFFGVEMYWSNFGMAEYPGMLRALGFVIVERGSIGSGFTEATGLPPEHHPTLLVRRPSATGRRTTRTRVADAGCPPDAGRPRSLSRGCRTG